MQRHEGLNILARMAVEASRQYSPEASDKHTPAPPWLHEYTYSRPSKCQIDFGSYVSPTAMTCQCNHRQYQIRCWARLLATIFIMSLLAPGCGSSSSSDFQFSSSVSSVELSDISSHTIPRIHRKTATANVAPKPLSHRSRSEKDRLERVHAELKVCHTCNIPLFVICLASSQGHRLLLLLLSKRKRGSQATEKSIHVISMLTCTPLTSTPTPNLCLPFPSIYASDVEIL